MDDCIFCKIVKGDIPSVKVFENERVFAFEDINPIRDGHTLIIPKTHAENIWEMSEEDMAAVAKAAKMLAGAIRSVLQPSGIACLQLNGRSVNQIVMHYHLHLIPQKEGDPELTMTAWKLVEGDMERIRTIGEKIAASVS
jgi:histidine triad (HIT) family protein